LRILQSVAAHVKLLLDTPEHIWRLLEKKKYLHAGWLFLLARIVYQELVRDGVEDEDDWATHNINMSVRGLVYGLIAVNAHDIPGSIPSRSTAVGRRRTAEGADHLQSDTFSP
jgi:hypothetical protein